MPLHVLDISEWGFFRFHGPDAKAFLQGLVTADMKKLVPGAMLPACVLTPKGLLVADSEFYQETPETVLAVTRPAAAVGFLAAFDKKMMLSRSQLKCLRSLSAWLVLGPGFERGLDWPRLEEPARLLLGVDPPEGADMLSLEEFHARRVAAGFPWFGIDMDAQTLPLEARQEAAISMDKGCYMGQETVSRLVHRGHVNQRLARVRFDAPAPAPGTSVSIGGAVVGRVTSAAGPWALAMLRVEATQKGAPITASGVSGVVVD